MLNIYIVALGVCGKWEKVIIFHRESFAIWINIHWNYFFLFFNSPVSGTIRSILPGPRAPQICPWANHRSGWFTPSQEHFMSHFHESAWVSIFMFYCSWNLTLRSMRDMSPWHMMNTWRGCPGWLSPHSITLCLIRWNCLLTFPPPSDEQGWWMGRPCYSAGGCRLGTPTVFIHISACYTENAYTLG